jgi:hypothetical protein
MSKISAISYKGVLAEAAEERIEEAPRTGGCTTLVAGELSKRIVIDLEVTGTTILGEESLLEVKSSKGAGMMLSRRTVDTTNKGVGINLKVIGTAMTVDSVRIHGGEPGQRWRWSF